MQPILNIDMDLFLGHVSFQVSCNFSFYTNYIDLLVHIGLLKVLKVFVYLLHLNRHLN